MFNKTPIIIALSNISTILPFLTSTVLIWRRRQRKDFIALWVFFAAASITEIILHIYSLQSKPNTQIIDIYTPIEYGLLAYFLSSSLVDFQASKWLKMSIPAYVSIYLFLKISGMENTPADSINYISTPISFLLISGFASYALHQLCTRASSSLFRNYRFWIFLAIAVYYSCSTIIFAFLYVKINELLWFLIYANAVLNILHNALFTIGILWALAYKPDKHTVEF